MTTVDSGHRPGNVHPGAILTVLAISGAAYALLQSLVVPALPTLQHALHTSTAGVTWVFTSFLISASVMTPIAGRFGDMFGKRLVLVIVLVGLAAGSAMAAVVTTLPLMIVARAIQGAGGAAVPLSFGIVRDEFPERRVPGALALVSGLFSIGGSLGIVLAGPILDNLSYHWLFWLPCAVAAAAALLALAVIPESPVRAPGEIHWLGGILLSAWLVALLVAVSQAPTWGWGSPKTLGLLALSLVLVALWARAESRSSHPLVDMQMMRLKGVWTTNLATFLIGVGMYSAFVLIAEYVQAPASTGYGFGASVTQAGLFLLPCTVSSLVFAIVGGRLSSTVGSKVPLLAGVSVALVSFLLLAATSDKAAIFVSSALLGVGFGFGFAALANLIVQAVRTDQTGVATGMNAIVRMIGAAIGAEVSASVLTATVLADGYPSKHGYTLMYLFCVGALAIAVVVSLLVPGGARRAAARAAEPAAAVD